jgi:hypothetical protein
VLYTTKREPDRRSRIHNEEVVSRSLGSTLLLALTVCGAIAAGCASTGSHAPDEFTGNDAGLGDDGSFVPPPLQGLQSITIAPVQSTLSLTYGSTTPATVNLTATGSFSDGTQKDVTSEVSWSLEPPNLASISAGAFSSTAAGQFAVTALNGNVTSNAATVLVKLTGTVNPGNVDTTKLDGTPGSGSPQIAYPIDGALFPFQLGDLAFQVIPSASGQNLGRIAFEGDVIDLKVYGPCRPIPSATTPGACAIPIPSALERDLAGVSAAPNLSETVRLAAADGSSLAESASIDVRWAPTSLSGTVYYWSTPPAGQSGASEIIRMNLSTPGTPPEVYMTNLDVVSYAPPLSGGWACIGCHAISPDGTMLAISIGGASVQPDGSGSMFALLDVATRKPVATRIADSSGQLLSTGFATFSAFSADGASMVQELQGQMFLRSASASLASRGPLFASVTESITQPTWSFMGDQVAFTSWVPTLGIPHSYDSKDLNGNETPGAQIWTASASGSTFGTPKVVVPRVASATEYYPAISDDSKFVVFNESSCAGPATPGTDGYGASPCDGYDDPSARLRMVPAGGGTPVELDAASGRTSGWPTAATYTNSWPRLMPSHSNFSYKGQPKTLYWVAFSSRRPYGAALRGSTDGSTPPQIWFAAIAVDANGTATGDPSFAPVWLPQQNSATPEILPDGGTSQTLGGNGTPTGNHLPQWVAKYVPYTPVNQ